MIEITGDVIQKLKDDPVLTGLVKKKVYWIKPPGETYNYPFLTVAETANTPLSYSDNQEYSTQIDIAVDIFSSDINQKALKDVVCSIMIGIGFERQSSGSDEYIAELKCYHKVLNFSIEKTTE